MHPRLLRTRTMPDPLATAIDNVIAHNDLASEQMQSAVGRIMDGEAEEAQIAALLTALRMKGETVDEIVGAARAMIERCTRIPTQQTGLLDTCGTGGDALHTFNISTATALVVASCGVKIAKHGNRSVSSSSGSSEVLKALGVNIDLQPEQVATCIEDIGIGFCFAPLSHAAMKHAAPVRKKLGFRTIFNLLGPLTNPAGADRQLLGANNTDAAEKLAHALVQLGRQRAAVVCGNGELDEVSLWGETTAWIVNDGEVRNETWTAASFGLNEIDVNDLKVSSPDESADVIRAIFAGNPGPARDIVLANAAAALLVADVVDALPAGVARAAEVVDSRATAEMLNQFIERTRAFTTQA